MHFSHKHRPWFDLRAILPWPPPRFRAVGGRGWIGPILMVIATAPLPARAEPSGNAPVPVVDRLVAGAVHDGTSGALPEADSLAAQTASAAPGTYPGAPRARRRSPRAAAEIRTDVARSPSAGATTPTPPRDLGDLNGWLDYKTRAHVLALPVEARLFYRRGIMAHDSGKREEGERWVRAAAEMDPSFVEPHLTIAAWSLPGRPSQSLVHWAAALDLIRESFVLQAGIAANFLFMAFQSLLIAALIAGVIVVGLRAPELSHPWREQLALILRPATARWWALAFVLLPYLAGLGVVLPTIVFLGLLWPVLRARERAVFLMLTLGVAATPWTAAVLDRLATPLDAGRAPLHGVALLENEPWSGGRQQRLAALAAREPENPFLRFAHAWIARRGGDLATAEREYRGALERWPGDDRVLTNLGNVLAMQGRQDEALQLYDRASAAGPTNPAPHFNSSQIYTQRFEYIDATEALSRASALDFDLVRDYQSLGTNDGVLALVDQWIAPRSFWLALGENPGALLLAPGLPPSWRGHIETSGWRFSLLAVVSGLVAALFGMLGSRAVPLRACSNCGSVVCRRCAQRRREVALCRSCAGLETRAQNADFAQVLMRRSRRRAEKLRYGIVTALAAIVPGFGLIAFRRALTPLLLIAASLLIAGPWAVVPLPFELEPRVGVPDRMPPLAVRIGLGVVIYTISIAGYFSCVARARLQAAVAAAAAPETAERTPRRIPARAA